ncbi:hypothetical protein [Natrialba aegyptia]|uniref:Uncharacterized protein n=1 Tax=Natrialba aegyptia DSM 13077 TaxID=1227491 RepID=M0B8N1_9EURY|nr:hypothetical protein [Natrialba aegyptia]ELZ06643.1 hypothetical protein C480_08733 [Natrialba aegyptia DSM 13077]
MVQNPRQAYGALFVVIVAAISGVIIAAGFVAPEFVIRGATFWLFIGAVGVMVVCAIISWLADLPGILAREFGSNGGDH